jgi:uncharacterized RDD family membrane protein YckC
MSTTTDPTKTALGFCATCGAGMPADAAFCPACGKRVERAAPAPAPHEEPVPPAPAIHVPVPAAATPVPAPLLARGAAFFIDYLLLATAWSMALGFASAFAGDAALGLAGVGLLGAGQLYWAWLESARWQASVGKHALRLVVVDAAGMRLTFNRALVRSALSIVPIVVAELCILAGAAPVGGALMLTVVPGAVLMAPFNKRRLALHDLLTGTMVARRPHA